MGNAREHAPTRCLVVDDHQLVAQVIGGLLSEMCGLELQAICTTVQQALPLLAERCPDLLILDLCLPGERWQDVAEPFLLANPQGRIVFLTGMSAEFVPPDAMEAAVLAVVDKARAWQDLTAVISAWQAEASGAPTPGEARGGSADPDGANPTATPAQLPLERLTPREVMVFLCLGRGLLNKEIAHELGLTVPTVETYRKNLAQKLGISGAELVRAAALHRCVSAAG